MNKNNEVTDALVSVHNTSLAHETSLAYGRWLFLLSLRMIVLPTSNKAVGCSAKAYLIHLCTIAVVVAQR